MAGRKRYRLIHVHDRGRRLAGFKVGWELGDEVIRGWAAAISSTLSMLPSRAYAVAFQRHIRDSAMIQVNHVLRQVCVGRYNKIDQDRLLHISIYHHDRGNKITKIKYVQERPGGSRRSTMLCNAAAAPAKYFINLEAHMMRYLACSVGVRRAL